MNRDAKFINFSEEHELDYILKKYGKETNKENRDLLKEFGKKAKEFLGKTMLGHDEFYKYLDDNSLIAKLKQKCRNSINNFVDTIFYLLGKYKFKEV